MAPIHSSDLVLYVVTIIPLLKIRSGFDKCSLEIRKAGNTISEVLGDTCLVRIDATFSTGTGGLFCLLLDSLQHTSRFCQTFSVLSRYVCIKLTKRRKYCCND